MINRLVVIGAGQMGGGIALTAARVAGLTVTLIDSNPESLKKQAGLFQMLLEKDVARNKLSNENRNAILKRIETSTSLNDSLSADYIIEAVPERFEIKNELINYLNNNMQKDVVIATNTSSIPITRMAALYTRNPGRVIGMHFMNPVPVMKLVEVIRGLQTTDETFNECKQLAEKMGKTTALAADTPAFTANRLLAPYLNEAINVLFESGWHPTTNDQEALKNAIDETMRLGTNVPMGPLELADFVGLDTLLSIMHILQNGLDSVKYRPSPLLQMMVDAGWFGKKSGKGFYKY